MPSCFSPIRRWASVVKQFLLSGELIDLSIAIVIGDTFIKLVETFVDCLLTPILGFLFDGVPIAELSTKLQSDRWPEKTPVVLAYGKVLQQLIFFAIIAIMLTFIITIIHSLVKKKQQNQIDPEQPPTKQELILMEHTKLLQTIAHSTRKE